MDYIINLLTKALYKEKANFNFWEQNLNSLDDMIVKQANGNIHSNQLRVEELEAAIVVINAYKKSSQQRNWQVVGSMIELTAEGQKVIDKANKPQKQQFKVAK